MTIMKWHFGASLSILLFGSRGDYRAGGRDIDLYIEIQARLLTKVFTLVEELLAALEYVKAFSSSYYVSPQVIGQSIRPS